MKSQFDTKKLIHVVFCLLLVPNCHTWGSVSADILPPHKYHLIAIQRMRNVPIAACLVGSSCFLLHYLANVPFIGHKRISAMLRNAGNTWLCSWLVAETRIRCWQEIFGRSSQLSQICIRASNSFSSNFQSYSRRWRGRVWEVPQIRGTGAGRGAGTWPG